MVSLVYVYLGCYLTVDDPWSCCGTFGEIDKRRSSQWIWPLGVVAWCVVDCGCGVVDRRGLTCHAGTWTIDRTNLRTQLLFDHFFNGSLIAMAEMQRILLLTFLLGAPYPTACIGKAEYPGTGKAR